MRVLTFVLFLLKAFLKVTHIFEYSNPDVDVIFVPKLKHKVVLFVAVDNHKVGGVLLLALISGLLPLGLVVLVVFLSIMLLNNILILI